MLLTCACAPGMDGTKPTITVADRQKETASLWKYMVDAVFVFNKLRCRGNIYVNGWAQVFSNQFSYEIFPSFERWWPDENERPPHSNYSNEWMTHLLFNDIWTDGKFDGFEKEIAMTRGVRPKNRASKSKSKNKMEKNSSR